MVLLIQSELERLLDQVQSGEVDLDRKRLRLEEAGHVFHDNVQIHKPGYMN